MGGIKRAIESVGGTIEYIKGVFQSLWDSVSRVFNGIADTIQNAWDRAGHLIDKFNPFKSEMSMSVTTDSNPYESAKMSASGGFGGMLANSMRAINGIGASITAGVNSTMNNFAGISSKGRSIQASRVSGSSNPVQSQGLGSVSVVIEKVIINNDMDVRDLGERIATDIQRQERGLLG